MKKTAISVAILMAASSAAQAAHLFTMTGGNFDFYDSSGVLSTTSSHSDVQASLDLNAQTGSFSTSTPFNGALWSADINQMMFAPNDGTAAAASYSWTTETWSIGGLSTTCRISGSINNCIDEQSSGGLLLGEATDSYSFALSDNQFAAGLFFDWSGNADIPILAVLQITAQGVDANGNSFLDIVSVDADGDGVPGVAMKNTPNAGQTIAFSGRLICTDCPIVNPVPVPAAVWLFGSGLLGLAGFARRRKAA